MTREQFEHTVWRSLRAFGRNPLTPAVVGTIIENAELYAVAETGRIISAANQDTPELQAARRAVLQREGR